jgi:hypothetical protein
VSLVVTRLGLGLYRPRELTSLFQQSTSAPTPILTYNISRKLALLYDDHSDGLSCASLYPPEEQLWRHACGRVHDSDDLPASVELRG